MSQPAEKKELTFTFDSVARSFGMTSNRALFNRLYELHVLSNHLTVCHHYRNQGIFRKHYYEFTPPGYTKSKQGEQLVITEHGVKALRTLLNIDSDAPHPEPTQSS